MKLPATLLALLALLAAADGAFAQTPVPPPPGGVGVAPPTARRVPPPPRRVEDGVPWQALKPTERQALAPLEREWPTIDANRKQKWLALAGRFPALPPSERARISERMAEWARLTPAERSEARTRFQEAKQMPAPDRSARWEAYQQLPSDAKRQFMERGSSAAARRAEPPPRPAPGTRTGKAFPEGAQTKANVVPSPPFAASPRQIAPSVLQAAPGATTRLITRPAAPPAHQQSGMPKIAVTPEFVNRTTLQPRRGPQAAAVSPPPPRAGVVLPPPSLPRQPAPVPPAPNQPR